MEKLIKIKSAAVPLMLPNIDTDIIAPMRRILINWDEIGKFGFEPLRFMNGDGDAGIPNPEFPLNQTEYKGAQIMLCGKNFGCGSSRENAPEAIAGMGIRCLIGTSFGGIFLKNCISQGILPIVLTDEAISNMVSQAKNGEFTVDLEQRLIILPDGELVTFEIGDTQRHLLMEGLDNVGLTLKKSQDIKNYEYRDKTLRPWVYSI